MQWTDFVDKPGEHSILIEGPAGLLEAIVSVPVGAREEYVAMIAHPHSLQGGTMHNKVVTTLARACRTLGIISVRFNFRGVGQSTGVYDAGLGESDDLLWLARQWVLEYPSAQVLFIGFSFGSYVAYRAAAQHPHVALVTVAPPVHHFNYTEFSLNPAPWLVMQGACDDVVPMALVLDFVANSPQLSLMPFPETGHFFHGQLMALKDRFMEWTVPLVKTQ